MFFVDMQRFGHWSSAMEDQRGHQGICINYVKYQRSLA